MRTENERTGRRVVMILVLPVMLGSSSCSFNRSSAPGQLLDLGPPPGHTATYGQPPSLPGSELSSRASGIALDGEPVALSFSGPEMLTDTDVLWRVGDSAITRSYATYHWAAPPLQLVQQRVLERLSTTRAVVQNGAAPFVPLLQVSLIRFEQVYAPDGKSSVGQVSMQAVLVRDNRVAGSILLSKSTPAPTQDALGGVIALRRATEAVMADLSTWLERHLTSSGSPPPRRSATDIPS